MTRKIAACAVVAAVALVFACKRGPQVDVRGDDPNDRREALSRVMVDIDQRYPDVEQLEIATLHEQLTGERPVLLFDVREQEEYSVGRLANAKRLAPGASFEELQQLAGNQLEGATVVFYCSVGERSSQMARRVGAALAERGAARVVNLRGGIFAWHNDSHPLVDNQGATTTIHPFNDKWGQLLVHRDRLATSPAR